MDTQQYVQMEDVFAEYRDRFGKIVADYEYQIVILKRSADAALDARDKKIKELEDIISTLTSTPISSDI